MNGRVNSQNRFRSGDVQIATNIRENRSHEFYILDQTTFQSLRSEYIDNANRIRAMRLMEHLGRYTHKTIKDLKVTQFRTCLNKMIECLTNMQSEATAYKQLINKNNHGKAEYGGASHTLKDEEQSFKQTIKRNIKQVEDLWIELFQEGSLKRLVQVLIMLRIDDEDLNLHYQISEWARLTESSFSVASSSKNTGCCGCF